MNLKQVSKVGKYSLQGKIENADVALSYEQEESKIPSIVNLSATTADACNISVTYQSNNLSVSVYGKDISDFPATLFISLIDEIKKVMLLE